MDTSDSADTSQQAVVDTLFRAPRLFSEYAELPIISLQQVEQETERHWLILYDRVYDMEPLLRSHPGGMEVLLEQMGRDATMTFQGTGHGLRQLDWLQQCLIGELPPCQRIWGRPSTQFHLPVLPTKFLKQSYSKPNKCQT